MRDLALTIDSGTKGVRAVIFDELGNELAAAHTEYKNYYSKKFGYVEAPASMFWDSLCRVLEEIKEEYPGAFDRLCGITVAAQRDTATIVDKNGEALRDFISWRDRRTLEEPLRIPQPWRFLFLILGKKDYTEMFNKGTHAHWIKIHEPELWKEAHGYVLLSTYLIGKLTGEIVDATSDIAGHFPYDFKKKKWCSKNSVKGAVLQIEKEKLCELVDSCTVLGYITKNASRDTGLPEGLPVIGSGTDKGCETVGVGCVDREIASISLGTQATVETMTGKYVEVMPYYPSFAAVDPECYNPEITIYGGFWMIGWYIENFAKYEQEICRRRGVDIKDFLNRKLRDIPAGANGLLLQPYWGQENFKDEAMGSIIGFTEGQTKFHVYRAVIEGIGYALREGLELIEKKSQTKISEVALSGGGAKSDEIDQIMTDILGRRTYRVQTDETTGLGGAMAIYTAMGFYMDLEDASNHMVHPTKFFVPNQKNHEIYNRIYKKVYKKAYKRYRPLYKVLKSTGKNGIE